MTSTARKTLLGAALAGAAGLAYAQSGEGIRPAVESGLLAANVITDCRGDYSAAQLEPYVRRLEQRFGSRQPHPGLSDRIPPRLKQSLAGSLMKNHYLSRNLLVRRWFLRAHDKPLSAGPGQMT